MRIFDSAEQLIGSTPLVHLKRMEMSHDAQAVLLAKIEMMNPGGSVKDRVGLEMIDDMERRGL